MPVSFAKSRERPLRGVPRQAARNLEIFQDIRRIIKVDELVMDDGIVESKSSRHQQETQSDNVHFAGRGHVGSWRARLAEGSLVLTSFSKRSRSSLPKTILTRRRMDLDNAVWPSTNRR